MNLHQALSTAKTEEEVKDAYIKAIGLKSPGKGKVDIRAPNMWFEAKEAPTAAFAMFAQLLFYVREARLKGDSIPPFLTVIDREKAAMRRRLRSSTNASSGPSRDRKRAGIDSFLLLAHNS